MQDVGTPPAFWMVVLEVAVRGELHPVGVTKAEAFQDLTWEMYFSLRVSQSPTQSQALSGTTTFQVTRLMTGRNVFCPPAKMSCPLLLKQGHGHQNFSTSLPQERLLEFTVPGGDNRL